MTITDDTRSLRDMTDDQFAAAWASADVDNPAVFTAFMAEFDQRTAAERAARAKERRERAEKQLHDDWYDQLHAQRTAFEAEGIGYVLNDEGKRRGVSEWSLWTGDARLVELYGTDEIKAFFKRWPRLTLAGYKRQRHAAGRIQREEWRDRNEITDMEADDEHFGDTSGTGLADDDTAAVRHGRGGSAAHLVPRGTGRRAGRPVQPDGRLAETRGAGDMGLIRAAQFIAREAEAARAAQTGPADTTQAYQGNPLEGEMYGPGSIVPGEESEREPEFTPGDMKHVLDETAEFVARYVTCTPAQADVMTLFPAAANALPAFPAFGEMLFTANIEQAGKTTAMAVTASLCANPVNAKGTMPALQSELAAASNEPEKPAPVLYYDEISGLYGASGLNRGGNWVLDDVLRDGYKNGATRKWSVNRSSQEFSIHVPVLMTGRGTSLPRDIRTRTIVVRLEPGTPKAYFDMREAEPEARALAACLAQAVATRIKDIAAFRARGIHPQLAGRKLEVWEPLFAVAYILGGQEWLNRCLAAFRELAIAESEQIVLTPRQQVLRDAAQVLSGPLADMAATGFVGGLALADEMRRLDSPLYAARTEAGMAKLISDAMPVPTTQKRVDGKPVRGYFATQITEAWEAIRPAGMEDASIAEEDNPFAVTDDTGDCTDDDALNWDVTGVTSEAADSAAFR